MSEWTVDTLKEHLEKIIELNDKRYAEVDIERQKALTIKEDAVKTALGLASGDLRTAIDDLKVTIKPLIEYVSSQQGRSTGLNAGWGYLLGMVGLIGAILAIGSRFIK